MTDLISQSPLTLDVVFDRQTVVLRALRFYARHGVLSQERTVGGWFTVDLRLDVAPDPRALDADCLDGTVDYGAVYATVRREMEQPSRLLEHAAARVARAVLREFPAVQALTVSLQKDNPPARADSGGMGVELTARRR